MDVKPENIVFEDNKSTKIRIIDFGGAAGLNEGVNIYSEPYTKTTLLRKIKSPYSGFI